MSNCRLFKKHENFYRIFEFIQLKCKILSYKIVNMFRVLPKIRGNWKIVQHARAYSQRNQIHGMVYSVFNFHSKIPLNEAVL